jgi:hypothetical protein
MAVISVFRGRRSPVWFWVCAEHTNPFNWVRSPDHARSTWAAAMTAAYDHVKAQH